MLTSFDSFGGRDLDGLAEEVTVAWLKLRVIVLQVLLHHEVMLLVERKRARSVIAELTTTTIL